MLVVIIIAAALAGSGLDSPVIPTQPTIRSEIRRGMDAAWQCRETEFFTHMQRYEDCIDSAQNANRQRMRTAFEAFDVGLYRMARDQMANAVAVLQAQPSSIFDPSIVKIGLDVEESGYRQSMKALGLTEAQVDSVVFVKP